MPKSSTHPAKLAAPAVGSTPRQYGGDSCRAHACVSTHAHLEAVRKHHSLVVKLSSRFLATSESRTRARRKHVKHKIKVTNLNHDGARCWLALIVFTVPTIPAVPGVGAFHHPALPQGRQTCAALWAGLDFETPCGTMGGHPGLEIVIVVRIVPEDRLQAWKGCGRDERE